MPSWALRDPSVRVSNASQSRKLTGQTAHTVAVMSSATSRYGLARGFSCRQEGLDPHLISGITMIHGRDYVRRFLKESRRNLDSRAAGLAAVIRRWLCRRADFEDVWDLTFADA